MADPTGAPLCQREGPTGYMIADFRKPEYAKYEGKLLSDIAADMGKPWPEAVVELIVTEGRDLSKINFTMSEDNVRMQIKWPWVVIGTDAGGVGPRQREARGASARVRHVPAHPRPLRARGEAVHAGGGGARMTRRAWRRASGCAIAACCARACSPTSWCSTTGRSWISRRRRSRTS